MSFLFKTLLETYNANQEIVGKIQYKRNGMEYMLLPVSHSTQIAAIEVTIALDGTFHSAEVVTENNNTVIPVTEESSNRTANITPHPLHDKLMYVAGDFLLYTGDAKKAKGFPLYIEALAKWVEFPFANSEVTALYNYLSKGRLIEDLVQSKVILLSDDNKIQNKWTGARNEKPPIFSNVAAPSDSFVRFRFIDEDGEITNPWESEKLIQNFIDYSQSQLTDLDVCYITGEYAPTSNIQPSKIRSGGDKAKLISVNSANPLGYLGRFTDSKDNFAISFEASQKAHNALKWLIIKQGFIIDGRTFLIWNKQANSAINLFEFIWSNKSQEQVMELIDDISMVDNYFVLILDSQIIGRLSVLSFKQFKGSELHANLMKWFHYCSWLLPNIYNEESGKFEREMGTPSLKSIINHVYVRSVAANNDTLYKSYIRDFLEQILNGKELPRTLINPAFNKIKNRHSYSSFEWNKELAIFCSLLNYQAKGEIDLALDHTNQDRSYLYGRLLAVAEVLEYATYKNNEYRETNAERLTSQLAIKPAVTWEILKQRIQPYERKLGKYNARYQKVLNEIMALFNMEDFISSRPLEPQYLLGYYQQKHALYQKNEVAKKLTNKPHLYKRGN
ncbi:type I-C CRISPR-associated protein Cas8c/Csd1 [Solibacillus isronensis]|uniref:type I-C CRISPR-associated protein Cas8c/Csd1 n=1 Tax=Solibacillus isronensis TaxID=412383 RepID=UPI0009A5B39C|nr:type I-C CRISPR-associated protein Cas8c/Csd1 [Solibacillus isronensis]